MAKRKAAKKATTGGTKTNQSVEPMVIALAEQLGSFLGRAQRKADGWMENEALRQQLSLIRDGAADLLKQVNRAGAAVQKSVTGTPAKKAKKSKSKGKRKDVGAPDAPSRRLRKPPPQELFDPRLGEPMGKQMGQKSLKRRGRA